MFLSPKDILQQTGFSKNPKGPAFTGLKLRFLSLRYSADFRRSRFVDIGCLHQ